jgi:hypothetical protein
MQEYPINKHEITIIVNQYLVKGDWFYGDVGRNSSAVYNHAGDSLSRIN